MKANPVRTDATENPGIPSGFGGGAGDGEGVGIGKAVRVDIGIGSKY
jgi:hypothetical protein